MKKNELSQILFEINDNIRGEVNLDEIKLPMMALLTLKSLMDNRDQPFQIPNDLTWMKLATSSLGIQKHFRGAFQRLEDMNPLLEGIFTRADLEKLSEKILFYMVQRLSLVSLDRKNMPNSHPITGTLAVDLDKWLSKVDITTPSEIGDLLVALIQPEGSIYDGATGLGGFLIKAAAVSEGHKVTLYGQEMNEETWILCRMNLILHGLYNVEISLSDTLSSPLMTHENDLRRFDTILMDPPFGANWNKKKAEDDIFGRFRFGIPSASNSDMAFVQHAIHTLAEGGRAALVVSHGALFRSIEQQIRRALVLEDLIEAVIGLPPALYQQTKIPVTVLVINKDKAKERKGKILLIHAEEFFEKGRGQNHLREIDIERIINTYTHFSRLENYSIIVDAAAIEAKEWKLTPKVYFEKREVDAPVGKVRVTIDHYEKESLTITLKEISEDIFRGIQLPGGNETEEKQPTYKVVNMSDIQDGQINIDGLSNITIEDYKRAKRFELRKGDVVLSARGMNTKVAVVPESDEIIILSHNLIGVRLRPQVDPLFLKAFLESPIGMYYLNKYLVGSMVPVLLQTDLENMLIPNISLDKQKNILALLEVADQEKHEVIKAAQEEWVSRYRDAYVFMDIGDSMEYLEG